MKYRIHFQVKVNRFELADDSMVIEGETLNEIRDKSAAELKKRGGLNPHSEKLED